MNFIRQVKVFIVISLSLAACVGTFYGYRGLCLTKLAVYGDQDQNDYLLAKEKLKHPLVGLWQNRIESLIKRIDRRLVPIKVIDLKELPIRRDFEEHPIISTDLVWMSPEYIAWANETGYGSNNWIPYRINVETGKLSIGPKFSSPLKIDDEYVDEYVYVDLVSSGSEDQIYALLCSSPPPNYRDVLRGVLKLDFRRGSVEELKQDEVKRIAKKMLFLNDPYEQSDYFKQHFIIFNYLGQVVGRYKVPPPGGLVMGSNAVKTEDGKLVAVAGLQKESYEATNWKIVKLFYLPKAKKPQWTFEQIATSGPIKYHESIAESSVSLSPDGGWTAFLHEISLCPTSYLQFQHDWDSYPITCSISQLQVIGPRGRPNLIVDISAQISSDASNGLERTWFVDMEGRVVVREGPRIEMPGIFGLAWSPDNKKLAYLKWGKNELWIADFSKVVGTSK